MGRAIGFAWVGYSRFRKDRHSTDARGDAHAWFGRFQTRQKNIGEAGYCSCVLVENGGEGSVMAAPIFERAFVIIFLRWSGFGWNHAMGVGTVCPVTPTPTSHGRFPSEEDDTV